MRVRKKNWAINELAENTTLIREPQQYKGKWHTYFGNDNGLYLELGCGKGGFIIKTAAANSNRNYIALERERMVIVSGMRLAKEKELDNIGFILADALMLPEMFSADEISGIFINFCDPWDRKKKWIKKRLTHPSYLRLYKQILKKGACITLKTDNRSLFEFSVESFGQEGFLLNNVCRDLAASGFEGNITTEYEERFMKEGRLIYRLEALNT